MSYKKIYIWIYPNGKLMKKNALLLIFAFVLLINIAYAGSKISIDLDYQFIKTIQATSTGQGEVYTDNSQTTTAIATTVTTTKNNYDTKFIASGTLARNPEESSNFVYNFIDGTSSWTHDYLGNYKMESTGVTTVIENIITTTEGSGTVNLEYIPDLSTSYLSINPYTGDFALSIGGCFDVDSSGNPVTDYSNAAKVLKWSTTTTLSGAMDINHHDEGFKSIGEAGTDIECGAYITGNVFADTKEVDGDVWIVKVTKDETEDIPSPFNQAQFDNGASMSGSNSIKKKYDLTITMPRISDDPDFNLDPLDISRPSDLPKLDISNDPANIDFNFDVLDISRPSDLDKLDITVDNTQSENINTIDIDYSDGDNSAVTEDSLPGMYAILDGPQINSIKIKFESRGNMKSLIVQGYYIDESLTIKKSNIIQARSEGKKLIASKEKLLITKEARQSIEKLFSEVKDNKGKIINFYRIQSDITDLAPKATIKFLTASNKFDALSDIKLIKIEDDGSSSEVPIVIENEGKNKIITAETNNFSYFLITAEPGTNTGIFGLLNKLFIRLFSLFKS